MHDLASEVAWQRLRSRRRPLAFWGGRADFMRPGEGAGKGTL